MQPRINSTPTVAPIDLNTASDLSSSFLTSSSSSTPNSSSTCDPPLSTLGRIIALNQRHQKEVTSNPMSTNDPLDESELLNGSDKNGRIQQSQQPKKTPKPQKPLRSSPPTSPSIQPIPQPQQQNAQNNPPQIVPVDIVKDQAGEIIQHIPVVALDISTAAITPTVVPTSSSTSPQAVIVHPQRDSMGGSETEWKSIQDVVSVEAGVDQKEHQTQDNLDEETHSTNFTISVSKPPEENKKEQKTIAPSSSASSSFSSSSSTSSSLRSVDSSSQRNFTSMWHRISMMQRPIQAMRSGLEGNGGGGVTRRSSMYTGTPTTPASAGVDYNRDSPTLGSTSFAKRQTMMSMGTGGNMLPNAALTIDASNSSSQSASVQSPQSQLPLAPRLAQQILGALEQLLIAPLPPDALPELENIRDSMSAVAQLIEASMKDATLLADHGTDVEVLSELLRHQHTFDAKAVDSYRASAANFPFEMYQYRQWATPVYLAKSPIPRVLNPPLSHLASAATLAKSPVAGPSGSRIVGGGGGSTKSQRYIVTIHMPPPPLFPVFNGSDKPQKFELDTALDATIDSLIRRTLVLYYESIPEKSLPKVPAHILSAIQSLSSEEPQQNTLFSKLILKVLGLKDYFMPFRRLDEHEHVRHAIRHSMTIELLIVEHPTPLQPGVPPTLPPVSDDALANIDPVAAAQARHDKLLEMTKSLSEMWHKIAGWRAEFERKIPKNLIDVSSSSSSSASSFATQSIHQSGTNGGASATPIAKPITRDLFVDSATSVRTRIYAPVAMPWKSPMANSLKNEEEESKSSSKNANLPSLASSPKPPSTSQFSRDPLLEDASTKMLHVRTTSLSNLQSVQLKSPSSYSIASSSISQSIPRNPSLLQYIPIRSLSGIPFQVRIVGAERVSARSLPRLAHSSLGGGVENALPSNENVDLFVRIALVHGMERLSHPTANSTQTPLVRWDSSQPRFNSTWNRNQWLTPAPSNLNSTNIPLSKLPPATKILFLLYATPSPSKASAVGSSVGESSSSSVNGSSALSEKELEANRLNRMHSGPLGNSNNKLHRMHSGAASSRMLDSRKSAIAQKGMNEKKEEDEKVESVDAASTAATSASHLALSTTSRLGSNTTTKANNEILLGFSSIQLMDESGQMRSGLMTLNLWTFFCGIHDKSYNYGSMTGNREDLNQIMRSTNRHVPMPWPPKGGDKEADTWMNLGPFAPGASSSHAPPNPLGAHNMFAQLTVEFQKFTLPVVCPIEMRSVPPPSGSSAKLISLSLHPKSLDKLDRRQLAILLRSDPLYQLKSSDLQLLWLCRRHLVHFPNMLPKFFQSIDWTNVHLVEEAHSLLKVWAPPIDAVHALELLDAKFPDMIVREYAVNKLDTRMDDAELQLYLLQLTQCLKFEPYHSSPLSRFLIRRSLSNPYQIGHHFFWHLKAEMCHLDFQERFTLILEEYLSSAGLHAIILRTQANAVNKLQKIAELIVKLKVEQKASDAVATKEYHAALHKLNRDFFDRLPGTGTFQVPLHPKLEAKRLIVDKCRFMSSKKVPLWLVFENGDPHPNAQPIYIIFKSGDDLRQDILTLQLLKIMDKVSQGNGENKAEH